MHSLVDLYLRSQCSNISVLSYDVTPSSTILIFPFIFYHPCQKRRVFSLRQRWWQSLVHRSWTHSVSRLLSQTCLLQCKSGSRTYYPVILHKGKINETEVGYYYGYIVSSYSLGGVFGALFWGWFADTYGRKTSIISCLSCLSCCSLWSRPNVFIFILWSIYKLLRCFSYSNALGFYERQPRSTQNICEWNLFRRHAVFGFQYYRYDGRYRKVRLVPSPYP